MKVAFVGNTAEIERVFGRGRREAVEQRAEVLPGVVSRGDPRLYDAEAIFSTWGMPTFSDTELEQMHALRVVFYAAGAVGYFSKPLIDRGIAISSAWNANAIPVAEFALAQILLGCKGYFRNVAEYRARHSGAQECFRGSGIYGSTVALLGAGAVGTKLIQLLKPFHFKVIVFDPFLSEARAVKLGVAKVSLEVAFSGAIVISNHLLDVPETVGMIGLDLLSRMPPNSVFINTGRGKTVRMLDLLQLLAIRKDLTALLDVTDPEPLPLDHPLWSFPNAVISTHIAGSIGDEVLRLADCAIEEFDRYRRGEPLRYQVFS